jgi:hypothetical protein
MISSEQIATLINHPEVIGRDQLNDLEQLSREYPFSPVFPQLYLKGLAIHDPITFEKKLKQYAYRVPNRSQLYALVNSVSNDEQPQDKDTENTPTAGKEISDLNDKNNLDDNNTSDSDVTNAAVENINIITVQEETVVDDLEVDTNSKLDHAELDDSDQDEVQLESNEDISDEVSHNEIDGLERDILAHAVSSSIFLEVDEAEFTDELQGNVNQEKDIQRGKDSDAYIELLTSTSDEIEEVDHFEEESETDALESGQQINTSGKKSFTGWMSSFIEEEKDSTSIKKKVDFKEKHRLEKPVQSFFSPVEKAKESLDESRLPVSETLAKIYEAQGNYPKSIEAYEKLLLKFPEKKSFFALQIESLKRKLN